jgi:hypothetical protein
MSVGVAWGGGDASPIFFLPKIWGVGDTELKTVK